MKTRLLTPIVVLGAITFAQAQSTGTHPGEVEITAEPHHHLALENAYVRVFKVEIDPRDATLMHRHQHDYIAVSIGAAEISNEVAGKPGVTIKMPDGDTRAANGGFAHIVRDVGIAPFRNVTVELLQDQKNRSAPAKWDEDRGLDVLQGGTQQILFIKDGVRVSEYELNTAGVIPKHHHAAPRLVIALTDYQLRSDVAGKGASNIEMKTGDVRWVDGGFTHTVTNVGPKEAKFVTLEFP
jgi:hypothetical protein